MEHKSKPIQSIFNLLRNGNSLTDEDLHAIVGSQHTSPQLTSLVVKLAFKQRNSIEEKLIKELRNGANSSDISAYISLFIDNTLSNTERSNNFKILEKFKNTGTIKENEIKSILELYNRNKIDDCFMAAFLATICNYGLSEENTTAMSYYMRDSGNIFDYRNSEQLGHKKVIRRYPTGALSEKIALIMPSVIAALAEKYPVVSNFLVAKTLSYTGGTWDKLSCIPGFKFPLQGDETISIMQKSHAAMSVTNADFNPLDRKLYQLRGSTGTVESIALIVSSIASKQLAIPADFLLMDVRFGSGAFLKTQSEAVEMSTLLVKILSKEMNVDYMLTEASQPTGTSIGNILEVIEAINVLKPLATNKLWNKQALFEQKQLVILMVAKMMNFVIPNSLPCFYESEIESLFQNGKVLESFKSLLISHSVSEENATKIVDNPEHLIEKYTQYNIESKKSGTVVGIDQETLGTFVNFELQTGLNEFTIKKDNGAGVILKVRLGDEINQGETLCSIVAYEEYMENNRSFIHDTFDKIFSFS